MTLEKKIQEKKLKMEIKQSDRVNNFIVKNYEKSKKYLNKKREKEKNDGEDNNEDINDNNNNKNFKENKNKEISKYKQKKLID
jgi:hypothetical protein